MSAQSGRGLPWSRGRGFRPKGPFQPARRPGESAAGGGSSKQAAAETNHVNPSHGNSSQGYNKPSSSYQGNSNQVNNGYMSNKETGNNTNQRQSNMTNGYQDRRNQGNSYQGGNQGNRNQGGNQGNSYQGNRNQGGNQGNSYQGNRNQGGNQGNSYQGNRNQGNSTTRDIRFAGKALQQNSSGNSGAAANQVQSKQNGNGQGDEANEKRLLAKYNYKANPNSPLGEPELSLSQGQKVSLIQKHASNDQWWKVRADDGSVGYVPATYVMILESKPSALPWLENKKAEADDLPECKPVYKPYKSAYDKEAPAKKEPEEKKPNPDWYCRTCEKQLNGPKPYGAHMASKMHREEVEIAKENGTYVDDY